MTRIEAILDGVSNVHDRSAHNQDAVASAILAALVCDVITEDEMTRLCYRQGIESVYTYWK